MDVFGCKLHGQTTLAGCHKCPDHTSKLLGEPAIPPEGEKGKAPPDSLPDPAGPRDLKPEHTVDQVLARLAVAPPGSWPGDWHQWPNVKEAHRLLASQFAREGIPSYLGGYQGRGIVIAGGARPLPGKPWGYLPSLWVLLNKLRILGCHLPVQVWYLGPEEMDPCLIRLLAGLGAECVDGRQLATRHPCRILGGWELKVYATVHSPFEEVLFLDADNAPINCNPAELFADPAYLDRGAMFWPDFNHWKLTPAQWAAFGLPYRDEPAFESGQFLIHKRRCWRPLRMALWYAEHSDFTFRHVYGDKEVFHLGWRLAGWEYAMPVTPPAWECGRCIVQHDLQGRRILLHRCGDKWRLDGVNWRWPGLEDEDLHFELVDRLRAVWSGRLWFNPVPRAVERVAALALAGRPFLYRVDGRAGRQLVLDPGGRVGGQAGPGEMRWDVHELDGQILLSISGEDGATCIFRQCPQTGAAWQGELLGQAEGGAELRLAG